MKVREIKNLHLARNSIQHHGIIPTFDEVRRYRILTQIFLEDVMSQLFDVSLAELSLGTLIKNEAVRALYLKADNAFSEAKYRDSLIFCIAAFETAKTQEQLALHGSGIVFRRLLSAGQVPEMVEKLLDTMTEELEILKLRLDYKEYQKYRDISSELKPFLRLSGEKALAKVEEIICEDVDKFDSQTLKDCARFCLDFSIENILRWESITRKGLPSKAVEILPPDDLE